MARVYLDERISSNGRNGESIWDWKEKRKKEKLSFISFIGQPKEIQFLIYEIFFTEDGRERKHEN